MSSFLASSSIAFTYDLSIKEYFISIYFSYMQRHTIKTLIRWIIFLSVPAKSTQLPIGL